MPPHLHSEHWTPDWSALWRFGACWAGRPIGGVLLPGNERANTMVAVMDQFLAAHPGTLPSPLQCHAFIQEHAVRIALEATREARLASGDPARWHDAAHRSTTPVIDIAELQRTDAHGQLISHHWQHLHQQMKPRTIGFLRGEGIPDADAEDLFAEAIAGMVQVRKNGTAIIQDLLVYEQVPVLFLSIVRRRLSNHLRHRHAEKRAVNQTVSLNAQAEDALETTDHSAFTSWEADAADPFSGLTFARLAEECANSLSTLQQHILHVLYIDESATYMEVAAAPWFINGVGIKASASDATRRRALDREHDSALDHLAQNLGIARNTGSRQVI